MTVYLAESGEYEQRGVTGIYISEEAALAGIKATYPAPYVVVWDAPTRNHDELTLTGRFSAVPHYSTEHVAQFDIRPMVVEGSA